MRLTPSQVVVIGSLGSAIVIDTLVAVFLTYFIKLHRAQDAISRYHYAINVTLESESLSNP